MEVLRGCPLAIAQRLVHRAIALSTAVLDRVTKTMSVAPLLMNNLDNSKQKTSNLLSPAPPPYSWSLLGKSEGPAPPPSSKISWSFDLAWNPVLPTPLPYIYIHYNFFNILVFLFLFGLLVALNEIKKYFAWPDKINRNGGLQTNLMVNTPPNHNSQKTACSR